jgi:hypothetical protein
MPLSLDWAPLPPPDFPLCFFFVSSFFCTLPSIFANKFSITGKALALAIMATSARLLNRVVFENQTAQSHPNGERKAQQRSSVVVVVVRFVVCTVGITPLFPPFPDPPFLVG